MKTTKYYLAAITAFTIWGFFSFVLKPIHQYPSLDILFYRVFVCAIVMLVIVLGFKRKALTENATKFKALPVKGQKKFLLLNLGGGLFLTGNWFFFIYVMNHISIKATSLAYLVCPILTTLLAYFLLKEKLSKQQWLGIALSTIGCALLSFNHLTDMLFSLLVAICYALYLVSQRINAGFDKFLVLTFHVVFSALLLLPFYPSFSGPVPSSAVFYTYIIIIAVVFTIIPLFLNLYALKGLTSSATGMLLNIHPIMTFIFAISVFNEQVDAIQITAYCIVLLSVVVFNVKSKQKMAASLSNT
ncbi:MAG: EamA family transporter [Sphingobacteriaceae bacterium]|nr:MAG: EamA family transporter [Sphingobacteriaceae bacterium]